jgi:hypothetical protein
MIAPHGDKGNSGSVGNNGQLAIIFGENRPGLVSLPKYRHNLDIITLFLDYQLQIWSAASDVQRRAQTVNEAGRLYLPADGVGEIWHGLRLWGWFWLGLVRLDS